MPTNPNMVAIQTVTVGAGGAANITFSNIPQTYTDLVIQVSLRSTNASSIASEWFGINFNGSSSNLTYRRLYGVSGSAGSDSGSIALAGIIPSAGWTASTFSSGSIYIPNYTSSNNKSVSVDSVAENNSTAEFELDLVAYLWSNTAAITSITIVPRRDNFAQYSTATLYGVTSAGTAAKATGGIITMDSQYIYHTFLASGTFTPTQNLTADFLVIAGGGGGGIGPNISGKAYGGGGGAGGFRTSAGTSGGNSSAESALSLTPQAYTVTVGAGGGGGSSPNAGSNGSNSVFSSITSTGGGGGGTYSDGAKTGGSGGGGGGQQNGANGTANQGKNGGNSSGDGAGGGGAGADGSNTGAGGAGLASTISGSSVTRAGGGGGGGYASGAGGAGGGGTGARFSGGGASATDGETNTGGGGGGGSRQGGTTRSPGSGGSGIVIVRYAR